MILVVRDSCTFVDFTKFLWKEGNNLYHLFVREIKRTTQKNQLKYFVNIVYFAGIIIPNKFIIRLVSKEKKLDAILTLDEQKS